MDCRWRVDSDNESIGRTEDGRGKVAGKQGHSDENRDRGGAVSPEGGHSVHGTVDTKPASEVIQPFDIAVREAMSSVDSGSKAKQREDVEMGTNGEAMSSHREDAEVGTNGEATSSHSSEVQEKTTPNSGRGGSESSAGGGLVFCEEPQPPATLIHDNSPANPGEIGGNGDSNEGGNILKIIRSKSVPVDNVNEACTGGQKRRINLLESAERLSEPVGMAVATVFHEVFEQNGDCGDFENSADSPVDELLGLLEVALKESLCTVLENDQRAIFVESFRNSFRSTYQTMRSVRRAFAKSGDRLCSSTTLPYPKSWKGSQSKPRRISPSQPYRQKARRNFEGGFSVDMTKHHPMVGSGRGNTKNNVEARHHNHTVHSLSEKGITSFTPKRYRQRVQRVHSPCSSSGKTCLNESLQSTFFTTSTREEEGCSDTAGSCSKSCLNESLESSFFTSSSSPEVDGQQNGSTESCSLNSINESVGSLLSQPTPDHRDIHNEPLDTEDTLDVNMFTAASSSERDNLVMVDRDEVITSVHGQPESVFAVTFDSWNSKKDQNHCRRVVEYKVSRPPKKHLAGELMDGTETIGSPHSPVGRCGDTSQHAKPMGSSDSLRRGFFGESMQDTKSLGSANSLGNLGNHNRKYLRPGTPPRVSRDSSGREHANRSLNSSGDRVSNAMTLGSSAEIGETSSMSGEPRVNLQRTLSRGADLLGRLQVTGEGNNENVLAHREEHIWGDVTHLLRPSQEDSLLPPVFKYGVRASGQNLLERYVEAQETQNHLKQLEIAHSMKLLLVKKDHLELQSESNTLMKENVDLGRSKIDFKEFELEDRKLTIAHRELSAMCADELVAGLCLMLVALTYSAWKFSYARLSKVVAMCQLPRKEPRPGGWLGTNWMANRVDAFTWQMQSWTCELTKAGRMVAGLVLIAIVASSLVRRSVTSSSQTMPITMIIVVLAGICGFAGKISIDSLGGDGSLWLVFWEVLCFLHAFATSCTPWLYKYLYGPSSKFSQTRPSFFMKFCSLCARFSFHIFLVFALPVMAGLLPFASLSELSSAFWESWEADTIIGPY